MKSKSPSSDVASKNLARSESGRFLAESESGKSPFNPLSRTAGPRDQNKGSPRVGSQRFTANGKGEKLQMNAADQNQQLEARDLLKDSNDSDKKRNSSMLSEFSRREDLGLLSCVKRDVDDLLTLVAQVSVTSDNSLF